MGEALSVGLGSIEQEILDAADRGEPGFCNGWVSSVQLAKLLHDVGRGRSITPNKRHDMLAGLGYVVHPYLERGRTHNIVAPDGKKPLLWVKRGHIALNETRAAEIARMYTAAQMPPIPGAAPAAVVPMPPGVPGVPG